MEQGHYLKKNAKFIDREVTKWSDMIKLWDEGEEIFGAALIGAPLSKPSISHSGACFAPKTIRAMLDAYSTYAITEEHDMKESVLYDCGDITMHVTDIKESHARIAKTLGSLTKLNPQMVPIILGGDHSISFPSISGFASSKGKVGIIQFDAHHDLRNLEDGGPSNGTPFRSLLENDVITGKQLVQIGIRNFSNARTYHEYAKEHGVTVYTMKHVREVAIKDIITESIEILRRQGVTAIYVSVDMDVLDQAFAPGCPAIGPGGMDSITLLDAITALGQEPLVQGMDIVEIDPTLDFRDMTSRIAAQVIMSFLLARETISRQVSI
ncbi:formimidoylglutamase [Bacillus pseudomycoides]|uniref:formimidoylglutamase n=1 Tax=Bacillus pseudomycoides TaxID=64104 RepID=UPI000BEB5104|nr:formimidoylglutamase [Bacillus pseudomycoides]PED06816.1 formimidoylglutamase [Bacillus pseudomycoides]PEI99778.1 formimidoylglutamase [Bacillus pseudomycoides]PEK27411.1 formimidoylglutamase [Bacillus pseudomycoides]PEM76739.1 formimidoylglutamase [Bacillus pseudomycoides]PEO10991.1 formimidoylglutamase [Bacillus pseudomycoides]